jgi:cobalt/nickel transport system ATP-binding protein
MHAGDVGTGVGGGSRCVEPVVVSGLSYAYPDGKAALRGIDLRVGFGEKVAVLGPNGAGKSTLLKCLVGVIRGIGRVEVFGMPVEPRYLKQIRSRVGVLLQDPDDQLFLPRVYEDVAFGPTQRGWSDDAVREAVLRALAEVGLEGFETRSTYNLSLGEKKRVALAGLLVTNPELYLLDEPTSGLDPSAREALLSHLERLPAAMVVATHDLDAAARLCKRAVFMHEGAVKAGGSVEELAAFYEKSRSGLLT